MLTNRIDLRSYHTETCSHAHDYAQLVLPVVGSLEIDIDHSSRLVNENTGVYIAPNALHCFSGSQKNLFLVIDITSKTHILNENHISQPLNLTTGVKELIQFTQHYLTQDDRDIFTDSLINQLILHLARKTFSFEPDQAVMKAKDWIDFYFKEPVDVTKVAQHCYLSVSQLQRRFKQTMGCSLAEYWRMKKLQQAKWLLAVKNFSIEAISCEVGYENVSSFSRRFAKVFGESPSQWRTMELTAKKMREMDN